MKKIITIAVIAIICLIIGGVLFLVFFVPNSQKAEVQKVDAQSQTQKSELKNTISFSPCDSLITNIKDSNKYLKIKLTFELKDEKSKAYYEKNSYKIKDIIINDLRNKTLDELISPDAQQFIKENIKNALSQKLDTKELIEIYIEDFVIQ